MRKLSRSTKQGLLLIGAVIGIKYWIFTPPFEAQMLTHFRANKATFEELRTMLSQDQKGKIANVWVRLNDRFSELPEARQAKYEALMTKINVDAFGTVQTDVIRFPVFGGGFTDTSWSIGYAWSKEPPKFIVPSAYYAKHNLSKGVYSRIEVDWYIYYRR